MMNIVLAVLSSTSPVSSMGTSPGKSAELSCGLYLRVRLKRTENMFFKACLKSCWFSWNSTVKGKLCKGKKPNSCMGERRGEYLLNKPAITIICSEFVYVSAYLFLITSQNLTFRKAIRCSALLLSQPLMLSTFTKAYKRVSFLAKSSGSWVQIFLMSCGETS